MEIFRYELLANDTYAILGFTDGAKIPKILQIPDKYEGKPITLIGDYAFSQCCTLDAVILGNNIRKIGVSAFEACIFLKSINLTKVRSIRDSAFKNTSIKILMFPESLKEVGADAFGYCSSLEAVFLNSVVKFKSSVFSNCSSLNYFEVKNLDLLIKSKFKDPTSNPLYYAKKLYINGKQLKTINVYKGINNNTYSCGEFEEVVIKSDTFNPDSIMGIKCKILKFKEKIDDFISDYFWHSIEADEIIFGDHKYVLPEINSDILLELGLLEEENFLPF